MTLREAYRDRWLLVVDKPVGLPTQPTRAGEDNLYDLLRAQERYVGLHHRLDRPASGLVLLTLDRSVNAAIAQAFRTHAVDRRYQAVLYGTAHSATWDRAVDGRRARTGVTVLATGAGMTAASLRLDTGRRHQIRQHAALAGTPVVGDRRYGGEASRAWPRLALHACALALTHPATGQALYIESPLPHDLAPLWEMASAREERAGLPKAPK